jgi:hypothetical protein
MAIAYAHAQDAPVYPEILPRLQVGRDAHPRKRPAWHDDTNSVPATRKAIPAPVGESGFHVGVPTLYKW